MHVSIIASPYEKHDNDSCKPSTPVCVWVCVCLHLHVDDVTCTVCPCLCALIFMHGCVDVGDIVTRL